MEKIKCLIWILPLMAVSLVVSSISLGMEAGRIEGYVRDWEDGSPIQGATVSLERGPKKDIAITDAQGHFGFPGLPTGNYKVTVRMTGYESAMKEVDIGAGLKVEVTFPLRTKLIVLEEIVVTAPAEELYPQTKVLARQIEERGPRDVGEFFREIPGASAVKKGGMALDPVLRGFKFDQLNVQIDGGVHVWGTCPSRMDPPTAHVQAEDLEKVEIFKGPYTVRFGPIFGGIVNVVMTKPKQFERPKVHGRVETRYEGTSQGKKGRFSLFGGAKGYDFYLSGGTKDYGNYKDGEGNEVQSSFRVHDYSLKLGWNPTSNQRVQLSHRQSFARDVLYPALPMDADIDDTQLYVLDYSLRGIRPRIASISAKVYLSRVDHLMSNTRKPTYKNMVQAEADVNSQTLGGRVEVVLTLPRESKLYVGGDYYDLHKDGTRTRDIIKAGPMYGKHFDDIIWPDAHLKDLGIFAEFRKAVTPQLISVFGIRADRAEGSVRNPETSFVGIYGADLDRTESLFGGSTDLLYRLTEALELSLSLGRGMRSPNITERYLYLLPVGLDRYDYLGDPDLRPEENLQLEVGVKANYGKGYLDGSIFYSRLSNYISAELDTSLKSRSPEVLGVKRFHNIDEAMKMGGELLGGMSVLEGITLEGSLAYTLGENRDADEPLPEMPPMEGVLGIRYDDGAGRFWGELSGRFVAKQDRISKEFGEQESPGFSVFDFKAGTRLGGSVKLSFGVDNLFNRAYHEHLNRRQKADMKPVKESGRNVYLGVNVEF